MLDDLGFEHEFVERFEIGVPLESLDHSIGFMQLVDEAGTSLLQPLL